MSQHSPRHLHLDHAWYFVTAATYQRMPLLATAQAKECVQSALKAAISGYQIKLRAWVLLNNHYHLLLQTQRGSDLPRFVRQLHGRTAHDVNQSHGVQGRQVWHNYWDTCVRTDVDLWTRFNYIHNNPVKHGYVQHAEAWRYSSYHYYLRTKGEAWLADCWSRYPVIEFLQGDDF
jgi:putative transposase